ncbi:O-antigen ligase family protein, partial [Candidatus Uhrbacteria bacterium]|nr:O-antigen ligase family protein [Candidatus Uhrbacteria bacterium]
MVAIAFVSYAILAWLRPRLALGVILFAIPFGHLEKFSIAGIPFTFPEFATYVLAGVIAVGRMRAKRPTPSRSPSQWEGEKKIVSPPPTGRGGVGGWGLRLRLRDPWIILPLLWILAAAIAAIGSPAGVRAWGIWKAYVVAPVMMFFVIRALLRGAEASSNKNHESRIMNQGDDRNSIIHHSSFIILPLAAGAVIVAAIAIAQRWWPIGVPYPWSAPGKFRATSVFGYPNAVGLFLGPIVVLSFGAAMRLFQWRQQHGAGIKNQESGITGTASISLFMMHNSLFFILTSAIAVVAIVFARSTGALVALVVAPFVFVGCMWFTTHTFRPHYPIFHDRRKWDSRRNGWAMRGASRWAAVVIAGWVAASLVLTAWLPYRGEQPTWGSPIVQKLTFQKWSGSVRLSQYRETWQLLRDHPIRGAGLAGYQTAIRPYHEKKDVEIFLYPHNLLLA